MLSRPTPGAWGMAAGQGRSASSPRVRRCCRVFVPPEDLRKDNHMYKVTIPLIALLLLALSSPELCAQPTATSSPPASATPTFATGWTIHVYKAPDDLKQLPTDALGSFIDTSGAPYAFHLYKQQPALAWYKGTPAYGFEGWLEA